MFGKEQARLPMKRMHVYPLLGQDNKDIEYT